MKNLQQYLKDSVQCDVNYHTLHAITDSNGNVFFTVCPRYTDGDTVDFWLADNVLMPAQNNDGLLLDFDAATAQWIGREAKLAREAGVVYVERERAKGKDE